jgi:hypothetical protein
MEKINAPNAGTSEDTENALKQFRRRKYGVKMYFPAGAKRGQHPQR